MGGEVILGTLRKLLAQNFAGLEIGHGSEWRREGTKRGDTGFLTGIMVVGGEEMWSLE